MNRRGLCGSQRIRTDKRRSQLQFQWTPLSDKPNKRQSGLLSAAPLHVGNPSTSHKGKRPAGSGYPMAGFRPPGFQGQWPKGLMLKPTTHQVCHDDAETGRR
jgi:hypothetical protein